MANNQCKNEYAKWEVRNKAQMEIQTADFGSAIAGPDRSAFKEALEEALAQLDESKRTVFEMRYVQDLSNVEIADALNISEGTVKSRLFYTLKELNSKLQGYKELLTLFTLIFMVP
jgi:RNA polymerase sigma-70 factor (ECF subfamily)